MVSTTTENETNAELPLSEPGIELANLSQALLDFEIANARVIDLTRRLTNLTTDLMGAREEIEGVRLRAAKAETEAEIARAELAEVKSSLAYRTFRGMGDARARWRR